MTENAVRDDSHSPDPVLLVGAVTWDVVDGQRVPGGAVTYAARAATALGIRAYVLVAAGDDADLDAFEGHELAVVRLEQTMTLEHRFEASVFGAGIRHQRVVSRPHRGLHPSDIPSAWPPPRTMVLGTLLPDDIDAPAFLALGAQETALIAQGMQRSIAADGAIEELDAPSEALLDAARPDVTLCLSSDETDRWPAGALGHLAGRSRRIVRTLGAAGAEIRTRDGDDDRTLHIPALPATVVDTTGAGDVFATALILAVRAGEDVAGRLAAACAAAFVERRASAPLPARTELEARAGIPRSGETRAGLNSSDEPRARGDR